MCKISNVSLIFKRNVLKNCPVQSSFTPIMSLDSLLTENPELDYRLIVHSLSSPKSHFKYVANTQYSFVWKQDAAYSHSVATKEHTFSNKTHSINFNKSKLKLRFNKYKNDDETKEYTTTKLILCERNNEGLIHLDEITLSSNYFVTNKRQATNITFNKIIANDIRIELKLKVTLIAKTSINSSDSISKQTNRF